MLVFPVFTAILISFAAGGGVLTPKIGTFDIGGFVSFSMFETNMNDKTPISALSLSARLGYSALDELLIYGLIGVKNLSPIDPVPTLNQFGIGIKTSLLEKERDININIDGHAELMPFLTGTVKDKFPNAIFWQTSATLSFKVAHSLIYIGGGYKDFFIRLKEDTMRARGNSRFLVLVGGDYHLNPQTYITVEMHSFGQSFLLGGISHRF